MLQGVINRSQKCQRTSTPNFLQGAITRAQRCRKPAALKGAALCAQQCHLNHAPTSFIWCRDHLAEMPLLKRTKGRAAPWPQQCHMRLALPTQFNGVIVKTQKCRDIVAPRGEPSKVRRDAAIVPLSQPVTGDTDMTQQCLDHNSPRERSVLHRRSATTKTPLPTNHRSRHDHAEMPKSERSTGRVIISLQKCHADDTLPHQSQGVTSFAQKCYRKPAPTEFGPFSSRRNATNKSPNNQRPVNERRNAKR